MARRLAVIAVTVAAVVIAALPIILTVTLGWYHTRVLEGVLGRGAGILFILVLVYVVWLPATVFGLVFIYDRLGLRYQVIEPKPKRPGRRERLRRRAASGALAAEEKAQLEAARAARERERSRAAAPARRPAGGERSSTQPVDKPSAERPNDEGTDAPERRRRPKAG